MIERSQVTMQMDDEEQEWKNDLDVLEDELQQKLEEIDDLKQRLKDSKKTIAKTLIKFFQKEEEQVQYADFGGQACDDDDDADDMDVDEASSGMMPSSSKVELDIYKYGSRVKQAMNSSFMTECAEDLIKPGKNVRREKSKTGSEAVR